MSEAFSLSESWQSEMGKFLDPTTEVSAEEQLKFMTEVHGEFGRQVAPVSKTQMYTMAANAETYPYLRLVPTPHHEDGRRKDIVVPVNSSPFNEYLGDSDKQKGRHGKLWLPPDSRRSRREDDKTDELWIPGVAEVESSDRPYIHKDDLENTPPKLRCFKLLYKAPNKTLRPWPKYLAGLRLAGDAIKGADDITWTYPLLDAKNPAVDRTDRNPVEMFKRLNYIVTPQSRVVVQLLHVLNKQPIHPDVTHITNEALVQMAGPYAIRGYTGVTRNALQLEFRQGTWSGLPLPDWQIANGVSALRPVK